jgi:hypothetical protein
MGLLTFALNITLDGCHDHREMIADDELLDYFTQLIGGAGAILYGRTTYELMEEGMTLLTASRAVRRPGPPIHMRIHGRAWRTNVSRAREENIPDARSKRSRCRSQRRR